MERIPRSVYERRVLVDTSAFLWVFLTDGLGEINRLRARPADERRAEQIIFQRRDKSYSFCDAVSFAVMERLGLYLAFTFDDHFRQHGFSTPIGRGEWPE